MLCRTVIGIPLELLFEVQYTNPRLLDVSSHSNIILFVHWSVWLMLDYKIQYCLLHQPDRKMILVYRLMGH